jgi:predicted kinase
MTLKLILTKGLPASGKSTWAREYIEKYPTTANLCKDDLRLQLAASKKREGQVLAVRNLLTRHYLENDCSVIWSDTNLNSIHETKAIAIAAEYNAEFVIQDFTKVDRFECIRRDLLRSNSVGERVINQMYYQYLAQPQPAPANNPDLPNCYLVDVDGTLAINTTRPFFAWHRVGEDSLNEQVATLVKQLATAHKIIIMSGRSEACRQETLDWLDRYGIPHDDLIMRPAEEQCSDDILKSELYTQHIRDRYNVVGVIDDRPKVCRMWRQLGLSVFQVGNPDHEF